MADPPPNLHPSLPKLSHYRYSNTSPDNRFDVYNPATGACLTTIQAGDTSTVDAAVQAAQHAFETNWRWKSRLERCTYLSKAADKLQKHAEELAVLLVLENGKPYRDALTTDIGFVVNIFRYFAAIGDKMPSEFFDQGSLYSATVYEPHGVVAGILPFNWPPVHAGGKLAPALAAGNCMILKPGEQAPLTVMRIVEILSTVFPPDVVQAVPGVGPEVPKALIGHPLVKMVSLTGSTASGIKAAALAAETVTPTVLELGGKNAIVVFEDADMERAVRDTVDGAFFNKGEACTASSRILVQKDIYEPFCTKLAAVVRRIKTGDGMDKSTHVGPVVSKTRQEEVLRYIELGQQEGATLAAQGALPPSPHTAKGYFVPPTLFTDVKPSMVIAQDEIFGPVTAVIPFTTEDEAVSIANDSKYGLFAGVYSADSNRTMRVARKLDVGVVLCNTYFRGVLGTPFGGVKESGYGREHWIGTLREWSRVKNIRIPSGLGEIPIWRGVMDLFDTEGVNGGAVNGNGVNGGGANGHGVSGKV
ncbi:Aldehyde dehydrogenase mpl4 [Xylographa carneopallida]|nr:Aldehyde dehydrogenase mpl4 [Xylographa carneopallida]